MASYDWDRIREKQSDTAEVIQGDVPDPRGDRVTLRGVLQRIQNVRDLLEIQGYEDQAKVRMTMETQCADGVLHPHALARLAAEDVLAGKRERFQDAVDFLDHDWNVESNLACHEFDCPFEHGDRMWCEPHENWCFATLRIWPRFAGEENFIGHDRGDA